MELSIKELRKFCSPENIQITLHAAKRLEQRRISLHDIISCIFLITAYHPNLSKWEADYKTRKDK